MAGVISIASSVLSQTSPTAPANSPDEPVFEERLDPELAGPFLSDPDLMALLDAPSPDGDCRHAGPLAFGCLIQARTDAPQLPTGSLANPFNLAVASDLRSTINDDLKDFQRRKDIDPEYQIWPAFLTDPGSRIQLVGVINRLDRQFINDPIQGADDRERCGEISLIYRFAYSFQTGPGRTASSRLPITMNIVFPVSASDCAEVARRWVAEMARSGSRSAQEWFRDVTDPHSGVVSLLNGHGIERIELNIQAYRLPASVDQTDFGSTAEYVIRVFRWVPGIGKFEPSYLTNQIDRARILGNASGDENSCERGTARAFRPGELRDYLLRPEVMSDVDTGTLNLPQRFLACRAVSASPGGIHRSGNQPFWNAPRSGEQIFTDAEVSSALRREEAAGRRYSFIRSAVDFRQRLNEQTCSGCHQARAIAGFHFPGAERPGAPAPNAVLLAGSPNFYGDQPRRIAILRQLAQGQRLSRYALATSYASRPLNAYARQLAHTQLLGGWGGACLMPSAMAASRRQWTCQPGLVCTGLFATANAPGMGTCLPPPGARQIGDPMQTGGITSSAFGMDVYRRADPMPPSNWEPGDSTRNTLIPANLLPPSAPAGNSYYAAHQEWYAGVKPNPSLPRPEQLRIIRDQQTGGFPAGMLRLSECAGLPNEATCGLVATTGFNDCIGQVPKGTVSLDDCFARNTSYAGLRSCTSSSPCRDDYICLRAIGYNRANGHDMFVARQHRVSYAHDEFGQQEPDQSWLGRNGGAGDQRGICIPPYFVFQFRSDRHPTPRP